MAFPATPLDCVVQIALGADLSENPGLWSWTDITDYVHIGNGGRVTITRGRPDEFSTAPPCQIGLTLINNDGRFCPKNPVGAYYGTLNRNTPLRVRVHDGSSYVTQALGFVDQWPVTWADKSETLCLAPITASGLLRRLGQGATQRSALYRAHATQPWLETPSVVGYWPCEDEAGSTSIASGIGGPPLALTSGIAGVAPLEDFAADSDILGSDPLMQFVFGVSFGGPVPTYTTTGETAIRCIVNIPTAPANEFQLLAWYTTSTTLPAWELKVIPGSPDRLYLKAYNSSLVEQLGDTGMNLEDDGSGTSTSLYGRQLYIEVDLEESGGGVNWDYRAWHTHAFNSGVAAGGGVGTEGSSTVGRVYRVACTPHTTGGAGTTLGHIAVATDLTYGPGAAGCTGFAGESVSIRFSGLATELDVNGLSSGSNNVAMRTYVGASSATDIVSLYRELETAEQGVLYDGKTGFLELLLREDRYNNAVGLSLDRDSGELDWIRPTDDDQVLYNDVTVSRPRGSERRALDKASVAANGTYASRVDALLFNDDVLQDHANWRLHLGTVDELRYPQVSLNLAAVPSLLADWLACDIGSRIQVTNPPAGLPPDTIDLHVEGYTESLSAFEYRVDLNCSPASPWQVFELEDDTLGRLDTDGSALVLDYSNSATTFLIASTAAPTNSTAVKKWSTTAEPYDLWIAGERVTVTNMASNAVSFVAAGTAVHGDNASLNPSLPAGIQDGDLLLICSAIRNTAAFVDGVSGGWTNLSDTFSNFRISAKRYVSGVSAPTVTFAGGSAGDTTSSQICAFRNVQLNVIAGTTQSNSSAANIATPALTGVDRDALLIIWAGWKQDDWTSVTGPGTEIGEPSSTTGNDQAFTWAYQIQTTVSGPASNTFTVTGGASAISRAIVLALAGDVQTATVTRAVNGVAKTQASGAAVQLWKPGIGGLAL